MPRMLLPRRDQLRWQLTLSHIIATAVTLVSMIAVAVLLFSLAFSRRGDASTKAASDARLVAEAVRGLVLADDHPLLSGVLQAIAERRLALQPNVWQFGPRGEPGGGAPSPVLEDVAYIILLAPDSRPLASFDPAGASFQPPDQSEWGAIARRALAGETNLDRLVVQRAGTPATVGAYPIAGTGGAAGAVVVALTERPAASTGLSFARSVALFGAATVALLGVSSVFALVSATGVAYLLSRRLVRRLERLGEATDALAAGDLAARVQEGRADEVGQLARRFNGMAADLGRTLHELEDERDRVSGLLEARRQLVASVSHELRTPVATVRGYLEAALRQDGAAPPPLRADLEVMEREIGRLQRMIDDLFTLARAQVGRLELRIAPVEVGQITRRLVETAAPLAWRSRQVQVVAETGADLPPVRADAQRLEQIVSNLLSNAIRHTPPGGLVAVSAADEGECVRIDVQDTGDGISPDVLPHIFERFVRGEGEGGDGAGLGLALVKDLAEAMGGTVEAASTPGEGSRFSVRLPRV